MICIHKISSVLFLWPWLHFIQSVQAYIRFRRNQHFVGFVQCKKSYASVEAASTSVLRIFFKKFKRSYFSSVVFTGLSSSMPMTLVMEFGSNTQRRLVKRKIQSMCSQKVSRVYSTPVCSLSDMETCLYISQTEIKKECICFIIQNFTAYHIK